LSGLVVVLFLIILQFGRSPIVSVCTEVELPCLPWANLFKVDVLSSGFLKLARNHVATRWNARTFDRSDLLCYLSWRFYPSPLILSRLSSPIFS